MESFVSKVLGEIDWERHSLIPAIAQNKVDSKILMLAYVNKEALRLSLESGVAHYFSRSKNRIWKKGEESGNIQMIKEVYLDCDSDAVLFVVEQSGAACHTGEFSCFFKKIDFTSQNLSLKPESSGDSPYHTLDILYHTLQERKSASVAESYTSSLYAKGENAIGKKIAEEAAELTFAIKDNSESEIIYECADLLYHSLVGLSYRNISPDRVMQELQRRFGVGGLAEKANRSKAEKSTQQVRKNDK